MPMLLMLVRHGIFLRYHVNMQFNKIPQLAMHCNKTDGGMISQGIGRGVSQTPKLIGCDHMSMGKPMNPWLVFFTSVLNHSILPKELLRKLMPWTEQGMEVSFVIELACSLREPVAHSIGKTHSLFCSK